MCAAHPAILQCLSPLAHSLLMYKAYSTAYCGMLMSTQPQSGFPGLDWHAVCLACCGIRVYHDHSLATNVLSVAEHVLTSPCVWLQQAILTQFVGNCTVVSACCSSL